MAGLQPQGVRRPRIDVELIATSDHANTRSSGAAFLRLARRLTPWPPAAVSGQVRTTPEAEAQIGALDDWWRRNRLVAPDLFLEELAASFDIIGYAPQIGRLYRPSPVPGTRRVLLNGVRYHVYYVLLATEARVLAVWHTRRGVGPPFRMG